MPSRLTPGAHASTALAATLLVAGGARASEPLPLHPRVLERSIAALAGSDHSFASAAARLLAWLPPGGRDRLALDREAGEVVTTDGSGARLAVDPCLADALGALSAHHLAVERVERAPVPGDEVARALREPSFAAEAERVFARAWEGALVEDRTIEGGRKPFEPGGVAYLEGPRGHERLRLVEVADPVHALARAITAARAEPARIEALLERDVLHALALDGHGLLRAFLERHPPGGPWGERQRRGLDLVLATLAANVADSWGLDETTLAAAVIEARPSGRYVGLWHGHPGRPSGDRPSEEDRRVAALSGRFLTLVEVPSGVEAWDLTRERPDPAPSRVRFAR